MEENKPFQNFLIQKQKQENADNLAVSLSLLMGANVVKKAEFDKINFEKQQLLKKVKDIELLREKLFFTECKLQGFVRYHQQWKPTTRKFVNRLEKLKFENVYIEFSDYPNDIAENLKEAYNCFVNGLTMACYIMILRTIEITANLIFEQNNEPKYDTKGKQIFVPALQKLNWVRSNKMIAGADYTLAKAFIEARNDSVHEIFVPTEKQLMSAFETVINLVSKLKNNIKDNKTST